jgi:hypothetical protein
MLQQPILVVIKGTHGKAPNKKNVGAAGKIIERGFCEKKS